MKASSFREGLRPALAQIHRRGIVAGAHGLTQQSVNPILKMRVKQVGLDPATFSAHGLRSGYLTEAANRGILLQEALGEVASWPVPASPDPAHRPLLGYGRIPENRTQAATKYLQSAYSSEEGTGI